MKPLFPIFIVLNVVIANSQIITVKDQNTNANLEFVSIYNSEKNTFVLTDIRGKADISGFSGADTIFLRCIGYETIVTSYNELIKNNIIYLEEIKFPLDEVVVSSNKWEQEKKDVPTKLSIVNLSTVLLQNPQTAADLLNITGHVFVQKSQMGGGSPMIRGFATNRVLITIDGIRMNNAIFRSGNLQNVISLDPFSTEKTEVIYGPGSNIYGSDAIGGVMSFYTIVPELSADNKSLYKTKALIRFSSANMEKTVHVDFNAGFKKFASVTSLTFSDYDDLRTGENGPDEYLRQHYVIRNSNRDTMVENSHPHVQKFSGYSQINLLQKLRYKITGNLDLNYGLHYSATSDFSRYDRLIQYRNGVLRSAEWYYGPQVWVMNTININGTFSNKLFDRINASVAYQYFKESRHDRNFNSIIKMHRTEKVDVFSFNIDFEKVLTKKQTLYYGAESFFNTVTSTGIDEDISSGEKIPAASRYPDNSVWNSYAIYLNHKFEPFEKITIQSSLRYSYFFLDAKFDTSFYQFPFQSALLKNNALTGSAGIVYNPSEKWITRINLSNGFRSPNIDDIGKVFDSEPGSVVVPNPDLKPENAWNAEIGIVKFFGKNIKIEATGYYTVLNKALVRRDFLLNGQDSIIYDGELSRVQAIQNAAKAYIYGLQGDVEISALNYLKFISVINYQHGEEDLDDGSTANLRHAPPLFGEFKTAFTKGRLSTSLSVLFNGEISYSNLAPSEKDKAYMYAADENGNPYSPSWYTLNIKASYRISNIVTVYAGIENLTNSLYRPYSSGISAPGRNVIISLKVEF